MLVPVGAPALDGGGQVGHAAVGAAPQPFRGQFREPTLDQVHPGAVGRSEVEREAGMALEPALDLGAAVGRHVVQDDMHREFVGRLFVDQVEAAPELAGPVSWSQISDHVARGHIQRGIEVGGAVTHITVGLTARHAGQHGPRWRRAIERLDLGLLVHAQHDGPLFRPGAGASGGLR